MSIQVHLPYLLLMLLNFTLLPLLIRNTGMAMVMMLVGMPLITLIIAAAHARKAGAVTAFALVTGLLFLPAIFLFFNESAWIYCPAYALIALLGGGLGKRRTSISESE